MSEATPPIDNPARMRSLLRLPGSLFALFGSASLGATLCTIPLYGVHGVGSAFVLGLVLPFIAALHVASLRTIGDRLSPKGLGPLRRQFRHATIIAWLHVLLPSLLLAVNALRVRQCEPWTGLAYIFLGPLCGTWLAALLAVPLSQAQRRPRLRLLLCITPPLLGLIDFAHNFYATPAVFAYGHFFGYFPGPIYDTVDGIPTPLLWLRLASVLLGLAVVGLVEGRAHRPTARSLLRARTVRGALLAIAATVTIHAYGPELGFDTTTRHVQDALGAHFVTSDDALCHVYFDEHFAGNVGRFTEDCEVRVRQIQRFYGLRQPSPITVYLFRDAEQKQALMGAAHTNIAKPWRNEIYLQESSSYPHPVMAHEIAHIVAGQVGIGPFRIAGSFGGLWPNPGLVEGMATAADPRPVGDLTPHQWARAALDADLAPPLAELLGSGFFSQQTQLAYTLTGSFLRYVHDHVGRVPLLRFYRTGDARAAFGMDLSLMEQRWHQFLKHLQMPEVATALAQQRFSGGSAFSAVCPNELERLRSELWTDLRRNEWFWAQRRCRAMLQIDPQNLAIRSTLAAVVAKSGSFDYAERELARMEQAGASATLLRDTRQAIADANYYHYHLRRAAAAYQALLSEPQSRDSRRQLQVKLIGLSGSEGQRRILRDMLVGRSSQTEGENPEPVDALLASYLARELRAYRSDGLPHYLEARQHIASGHLKTGTTLLQTALDLGLPTDELKLEGQLVLANSLMQLEVGSRKAESLYRQLLTHEDASVRWEAEDALERLELIWDDDR